MIQNKLSEPFNYQNDIEYGLSNIYSFWDDVAKKYIKWDKNYNNIWSGNENNPEWFNDGLLNACNNSLDVHLNNEERKNQIAIIHECPIKNVVNKVTYYELWYKVCVFSRVLKNLGIGKGDRVLVYMSTIIEGAIAMLSCARIGAIHCVTFAGFSSSNLSLRLEFLQPKLIIISNCGIQGSELVYYLPIINDAINQSQFKPNKVICYSRKDITDLTSSMELFTEYKDKINNLHNWDYLVDNINGNGYYEYELVESNHPLYILFTSGTTGQPKSLVLDTVGVLIQCYYYFKMNYKIEKGQVLFSTSDIGWVLGHNVNVYGSLINGTTSIFFEGDVTLPTPDIIFKICSKYNVTSLFTVPSEIRYIRSKIEYGGSNNSLKSLKSITTCGEKIDTTTFNYINSLLNSNSNNDNYVSIYDLYGATESAGGIITYCDPSSFNFKLNSAGKPIPGVVFDIKSKDGSRNCTANETGELLIKLPLPPFYCNKFYNDEDNQQFKTKYLNKFPGYYRTSDLSYKDNDGYYYLVSRSDDVININGDTIYSNHLEASVLKNPKVLDCSIIAVNDEIFGQAPLALVVLNKEYYTDPLNLADQQIDELKFELNQFIIQDIIQSAIIKHLIIVSTTLKNKSKKKIKYCLSNIFNKEPYSIPSTISNKEDFHHIESLIMNYKNKIKL